MTPTTILTATQRMQALRVCPVFSGVPANDLGVLAEMMQTECLDAGELLFKDGGLSDRAYVVVSGQLAILIPGRAEAARFLGPGELLGEYGMFSGLVRTAAAKAQTQTVLLSLDYRRFRAFLIHFPESMFVVLKTVVHRLIALERKGDGTSTP